MVMNVHYCMGKISSVQLDLLATNLCDCKKEQDKGCCKTEHHYLKVEDNHKASYADFSFNTPVKEIASSYQTTTASSFYLNELMHFSILAPPDISQPDTYLRICVFRI